MIGDIPNLAIIESNFFRNHSQFRYFINLTKKDKSRLRKLSYSLKKEKFSSNKLNNYLATMQFLTGPRARIPLNVEYVKKYNLYFKNYDEAIYFLIYVLDPKLEIFDIYSNSKSNYKDLIRRKKGFYNDYIIMYEKEYISKYSNKLISNISVSEIKIFTSLCKIIKSFTSITQERFDEIRNLSKIWSEQFNGESKINTCVFNAFNQNNLLNLNNEKEKLLFIILVLDPTFRLLQIFEDENNYNTIELRSKEELGFYIPELIKIEDLIYKTFNTDIKIDTWGTYTLK